MHTLQNGQFEKILETVSDGIYLLDKDWKYIYVNQPGVSLAKKFTSTDLLGKKIWEVSQFREGGPLYEACMHAREYKEAISIERYFPENGQWIYNRVYPEGENLLLIARDITQEKKDQQALQQSNNQLAVILKNIADGIIVQDTKGKIVYANETAAHVSGYESIDAMLQAPLLEYTKRFTFIDDNGQPIDATQLPGRQAIAGEEIQPVTIKFIEKQTNETHWLTIKSSAIFNENKKAEMVVSVMHDITQMKELEEKKDAFISMASHELKTPLTSIKVFVQILRRKLVNADTAIILKNIEEQIDKLTMLVRELLDISRMKKGKFLLNKEKISIKKLLQDAVATLSPVTNHHIYISSCINKKVLIDKERIYQVLVNLITNAIKYSPDHTDIILSAKEKDKNVIFSIKDYGIGISPEEQSKIFEQFYQVSTNHGNTFPGLGLGLYISSEIVKAHNGKICLKSIPSKGSTFYFSIPIDDKI